MKTPVKFRLILMPCCGQKLLLAGIAALFLATGTAHADAVYDDDWDWSGCKEPDTPYVTADGERIDEAYYSCENGRDFEFFKRGNKRGYKRGERICTIKTSKTYQAPTVRVLCGRVVKKRASNTLRF
jgi:hypothetical protein